MVRWILLCSAAACFAVAGALASGVGVRSASSTAATTTIQAEGATVTIQGPPGTDGTDGTDGLDGKDGRTVTGPQGPPGESIVGPRGRTGKTGAKGAKGDKGDKGNTGATGADGQDGGDCPPGFTAQTLTLNAPGGQVTMYVCLAG